MEDMQYSFAAKPRPVQTTRTKYKEKRPSNTVFNIMNDPRVVRGSVYAAANSIHLKKEVISVPPAPPTTTTPTKSFKKNSLHASGFNQLELILQVDIPVDLDKYLIEHSPIIENCHVQTQTDEFLPNDKHKKVCVLKKTGVDASTEIAIEDHLFDFDAEVQPLLSVLVNKTLQQARCEIEREHEMHNIALYLKDLHVKKRLEAEGIAGLVEAAVNKQTFKEKQKAEQSMRMQEMDIVIQKVAALKASHRVLDEAMEDTQDKLRKGCVFYDPLRRMVETGFMKWIYDSADRLVESQQLIRLVLTDIIKDSLRKQRILEIVARLPRTPGGLLQIDACHVPAWGIANIGPLHYSPSTSYAALDDLIEEWLVAGNYTLERPAMGYLNELFGEGLGGI
ncbi:radial spoke head protein 3-like [Thraustotheca clavata]|uniref:Radial spoke head protein 3-like n=1 Tax=Thraustotheca clavata TaxID=74557 RepID=A0A1W0A8V2_9STRA|nr:radial spoke head protein 3-like [Thraustotheca clavata]